MIVCIACGRVAHRQQSDGSTLPCPGCGVEALQPPLFPRLADLGPHVKRAGFLQIDLRSLGDTYWEAVLYGADPARHRARAVFRHDGAEMTPEDWSNITIAGD